MELKSMGIMVCWVVVNLMVVPAWGQDSPPPSEQPSSGQNSEQPAADEEMTAAATIEDAMVCQDVVDRAPVGSGDVFPKEVSKLYCYCRVVGAQPNSQITHNWYHNGSLKASVKLAVRSPDFRTWSSKTILPQWDGEWMVEILSEDGKPMESIIFTVQ